MREIEKRRRRKISNLPEFIRKILIKINIDGLSSSLSTNKRNFSDLNQCTYKSFNRIQRNIYLFIYVSKP